jgi:hypothetical protein
MPQAKTSSAMISFHIWNGSTMNERAFPKGTSMDSVAEEPQECRQSWPGPRAMLR